MKLGRLTARSIILRGGSGPSIPRRSLATAAMPTSEPAQIEVKPSSVGALEWTGDLLVLPLHSAPKPDNEEGEEASSSSKPPPLAVLSSAASGLDADPLLSGVVAELVSAAEFSGKAGEHASVRLQKGRKIAVVGLGPKESSSSSDAAAAAGANAKGLGAALAKLAHAEKPVSMAVALPDGFKVGDVAEGFAGGLYVDNRFRTGDNVATPLKLKSLDLLQPSSSSSGESGTVEEVEAALNLVAGVNLCKDLVNAPANVLTPESLAEVGRSLASEHGLACEILEKAEIEALGMGAYLGVSQGSKPGECDPRFIHLTYTPKPTPNNGGGGAQVHKRVALVGKGLTFDSGGYNLKAGAGSMIEMMKFDMGGSAAVLGAAKAVGLLQPRGVEVHFIVAACENMISDRAMRPGDVLTASNGKTIEVINTDAEGRLTLADALVFADNLPGPKMDAVVDIATLTGACIISLGDKYAGVWSSDEGVAAALEKSSKATGEKVWRMPLASAEYKELTKSKIADLTNVGPRGGGAITAALFLQEFTKAPWAHIDIAGPVWDGAKGGATGYGVKLLVDFVAGMGKEESA
eukprot:CAMPEP_0171656096 /NCGR_PEP_ID=MMETSP0990-20121206/41348_1 /TAXON_ID=483369 /ORGANISM="non described non described, Strain CCMP2098" /LENGTH=576 /DNA_ID=CAMNT_0012236445 /DNA_START=119 /DNA_END=1849 /DNA_ORIENTATION=+